MVKTEKGGNCRTNEIVYQITCKECQDTYTGETSRNGHIRGIEHANDAESNNADERERSVLLRHMREKHDGRKVNFDMKVIKSYQHNPLARQCAEAVWIRKVNPDKRINNKKEFHQPGEVEVSYEKSENMEMKRRKQITTRKVTENKKNEESMRKVRLSINK